MNWISVKDKLPENGEDLIALDTNNCINYANFWYTKFEDPVNSSCICSEVKDVTHWIYLKDIDLPDTIQTRYCYRCNVKSLSPVDRARCIFVEYLGLSVWLCIDCTEVFYNDRFLAREKWFKDNMCKEWNELDISKG